MKILMAAAVPKRREGGVAAIIYNLGKELERRGHSISYVFQEDLLDPSSGRRFAELAFSWRLARYIAERRGEFSVVNLHAPWGFAYGYLRRMWSGHNLPPYVMTLQGAEERYVVTMRREHAKGRADHFGWKHRLWHRLYHLPRYRHSARTADACMTANREASALLQLKQNFPAERIFFVPNGVDESFFQARDSSSQASRLLFVGTWLDRKGIYYLVESLALLASRWADLHLTVAGCMVDPAVVRRYFPAALQPRLNIMPFIVSAEMPALYAQHDIFVLPSLMEGMPLSLLEAMAGGMPVVTTDTCGMADVVEDNYNGLLVKPADAPSLAAAIERLLRTEELRASLGRAAQETMRRYTWGLIAERIEHVFIETIQASSQKKAAGHSGIKGS